MTFVCMKVCETLLFFSDGSNTILSNIERTRTSFFERQTNSNVFIYQWSNLNTLFLASNERTSNIELNRPSLDLLNFLRTDSNIIFSNVERTRTCSSIRNRTRTPYFWLLTIELRTLFDPSLSLAISEVLNFDFWRKFHTWKC